YLTTAVACLKIRAVPVNVNYRYVEEELSYLYNDADLVALVVHRELAARAAAVRIPKMKHVLVVDDDSGADLGRLDATPYDEALANADPERKFDERSADDLYVIYTGGTTGMPRGVMWRQEDVFFAGLQGGNPGGAPIEKPEQLAAQAEETTEPLTFLPAAPFIHGAAQWAALIGLFGGGKVVLVPGRSFNAKLACELIAA